MALARDVIRDALTEIGAYAVGDQPTAADTSLGLLRLQHQLDAWAADELLLYVTPRVEFTIPGGTASMTIGEDGDIDVVRPTFIQMLNYIVPGTDPEVETPMGRMDYDSYAALSIKALESNLPTQWFFSNDVPLATLTFWPVPDDDVDCALYYPHGTGVPASLNADIVGPAGFQEALMYALAVRLSRPFGKALDPSLVQAAADALARVKRPQTQPGLLGVDQALVPSYSGAYNVINDGYTGSSGR